MTRDVVPAGKQLFRRVPLFAIYRAFSQHRAYARWVAAGRPLPPPHLAKQFVVREYVARFQVPVFVETGTFLGDMVHAVKGLFEEVLVDRAVLGAVR